LITSAGPPLTSKSSVRHRRHQLNNSMKFRRRRSSCICVVSAILNALTSRPLAKIPRPPGADSLGSAGVSPAKSSRYHPQARRQRSRAECILLLPPWS
jgi:hypothetical protein